MLLEKYQNIPSLFDPIAFSVGSFSIRWYSLLYILSFVLAFFLVFWRLRRGEDGKLFKGKGLSQKWEILLDIFLVGMFGAVIGGRVGYFLLYAPSFFWENPLAIFYPFNIETGEYVGLYGMSYFGALIGIVVFEYFFLKRNKLDFWKVGDFVVPAAAGAYFLGRVGNFLNSELLGEKTESILGMYFLGEDFLRHPSQLYEAVLEGLVIFAILWIFRNKARFDGQLLLGYFMAYAAIRFFLEVFREIGTAEQVFSGILSKGQLFSLLLAICSALLYFKKSSKNATIHRSG